ncbi:ArsR/SmtB family transcription factor [Sulfuriroseicoccus oceanibius]|uniref:Winged helix-turn-helix transcriptional regulator n=1 Tax=Sulfuriroseicoccus oceanibius TaxID=2707525 RepID=A0A6B3L9J7_9BACT|nr:metalloregulator ArsR/SmtB family transcription factor [Sulfuriroseicoccus oceanibius]QQL46177.1 winged helix-turn-helix transcriptional regulator [Sulfuriroseicoccus oceanibius]
MSSSSRPCPALIARQASVFKALAHPGRMAMVHALADGPLPATQLATIAGCTPPTASRHLAVLRVAGVLRDERRGQQVFYHLSYPCVLSFAECIEHTEPDHQSSTPCCA